MGHPLGTLICKVYGGKTPNDLSVWSHHQALCLSTWAVGSEATSLEVCLSDTQVGQFAVRLEVGQHMCCCIVIVLKLGFQFGFNWQIKS